MNVLHGFTSFLFKHEDTSRQVFTRGDGPGVVVMHEVPGITPEVEAFSSRVAEQGFRVFLPHLFGTPGKAPSSRYALQQMVHCCISREFSILAARGTSPVTHWLRALCRHAHDACGGSGVGAIGMCMTGNFALALMVDDIVMAPVLSQPSLPVGITKSQRRSLHLTDGDLNRVRERAAKGCPVLGMRFTHDPLVPKARFDRLREELGQGFEAIEIDSSPGNPHGIPRLAHSVVTNDLVDEEGHPTRAALERVLSFFEERLR
jgi:dienelactone hydrolase